MSRGVPGAQANPTIDGYTYLDRCYSAAQQRRRYHADPDFRLDRINRARARRGVAPASSLSEVAIRIGERG